jgi:hypothetical protein
MVCPHIHIDRLNPPWRVIFGDLYRFWSAFELAETHDVHISPVRRRNGNFIRRAARMWTDLSSRQR